jgi:hypothetical protein
MPFHLALVVALGRAAELIGELAVTLQLGESPRPLTLFATQDPGHRDLGVVVKYPRRNRSEVCECQHMTFQEGLRGLGRKSRHEAVVGMRQIHGQVVRLLLDAGDNHPCFAKIRLRLTRRVGQRYKHLTAAQHRRVHVILHDGVAAGELVLFLQPIENPLGRMPLMRRSVA